MSIMENFYEEMLSEIAEMWIDEEYDMYYQRYMDEQEYEQTQSEMMGDYSHGL